MFVGVVFIFNDSSVSHHTTCLCDTIWKSRYTVANKDKGYPIKTVKYKSYYEK